MGKCTGGHLFYIRHQTLTVRRRRRSEMRLNGRRWLRAKLEPFLLTSPVTYRNVVAAGDAFERKRLTRRDFNAFIYGPMHSNVRQYRPHLSSRKSLEER